MNTLDLLNSWPIYLICGSIILFVMALSIFFMLRAWKAGIAIGMDRAKLRKTVISSCTFTLVPSISILVGVLTLSGSLGVPLPWLRLRVLGADVFAVARSRKDLSNAACDGCVPVPLDEYRSFPLHCDAVFNTIPHRIFDAELLKRIPRGTVLFELATANAGVDLAAAEENGIRVIPLPSLPGKTAPRTAGEIICSVVRGMLDDHFA